MHNNADAPYCYIGTKYGTEIGYDNPNIKFALSIEEGDWVNETDTTSYSNSTSVICSKSYKTVVFYIILMLFIFIFFVHELTFNF